MPLNHRFLKILRTMHLYLGVFTAPMLLFFAITGGLQTFGLHESARGSNYTPPTWLATMAQLHKKQTTLVPVRRSRPKAAALKDIAAAPGQANARAGANAAPRHSPGKTKTASGKNLWPMKIFFAVVAFGLLISVLSGLYMAWRYSRRPRLFGAVLAAGVIVPVVLLLL